jgi:hypothetical protein
MESIDRRLDYGMQTTLSEAPTDAAAHQVD